MSTAVVDVATQARAAREASRALHHASDAARRGALAAMAAAIRSNVPAILAANGEDVEALRDRPPAFRDRLALTPERTERLAAAVDEIAALPDPLAAPLEVRTRPNGMEIRRVRVPIGVVAMIYESRPNVTVDAAALCLRAGNAVILRGGAESRRTDEALGQAIADGLRAAGLPAAAVTLLARRDYDAIRELVRLDGLVDLVIPRGGPPLIRLVTEHARIPVLKHDRGVTHVFVDRDADLEMAVRIIVNAKTNRPSTCNALEKVLVDAPIAPRVVPPLVAALGAAGVEVRGDAETRRWAREIAAADDDDWDAEYLDLILAIRVVDGLDAAVEHIGRHGTGLADAIVTRDRGRAERFVREVDSAAVLVNASTRLVDGGEFGLGAEVGISTNRLHARGPMGLADLTTTKWIVWGSGQTRA
ncbi:MAG TPA: glutamate-5-semialdehyde dehydrogenase [bacterium]|nr:glutamate-5-semialdehyde dehydrogenase [bacterium]